MIITKEHLKAEIDKVPEQYLEVLYRIIRALIVPLEQIARLNEKMPEDTQFTPESSANLEADIESFQAGDDKKKRGKKS